MTTIADQLAETEFGQALAAELASKADEERRALAAPIEDLQRQLDDLKASEGPKIQALQESATAAQTVYREAANALHAARSSFESTVHSLEHRISATRWQLQLTADPRIDAFVRELQDEHETLRRERAGFEIHEYGKADRSGHRKRTTNLASIADRLVGIVEAIRGADELKYRYVPDIDAALDEFRASIPEIRPASEFVPADAP